MYLACLLGGATWIPIAREPREGESMEKARVRGKGPLADTDHAETRPQPSQIFQHNLGCLRFFKCEIFLVLNLVTNSN